MISFSVDFLFSLSCFRIDVSTFDLRSVLFDLNKSIPAIKGAFEFQVVFMVSITI